MLRTGIGYDRNGSKGAPHLISLTIQPILILMISEAFIRRPVTAIVISLIVVLVGAIAALNLPVSKYPQITPPWCG